MTSRQELLDRSAENGLSENQNVSSEPGGQWGGVLIVEDKARTKA